MAVYFELLGDLTGIEVIAEGAGIRGLRQLEKRHGKGRWRKLRGFGLVRLRDGTIRDAEVHWYEAHGIGRRKLKIKRFLS